MAAVIGLVLVSVWRLERLLPTPAGSRTQDTASLASRDSKNPSVVGAEMKVALEGDYNGDGKVDADDIQALQNKIAHESSDQVRMRDARTLAAKLVGG